MKIILVLAAVLVLAAASNSKFKNVNATTVNRQYKILELFETTNQINKNASYYKIGKDFNINANIKKYKKSGVVSTFFSLFEKDFLPKNKIFNIFNDKMRQQAKALYDVFYYAEDFETFYMTAAWARVNVNAGLFLYTFYVALIQRVDTKELVIPPLYEIAPQFFINLKTLNKMYYSKMRGEPFEEYPEYGVTKLGNYRFYNQNYSDYNTYGSEYKLAYLTEDIGWNTYYNFFHVMMPFWEDGDNIIQGILKERRGEIYYNFYKTLLAYYYLNRLSNGLGEIPEFSWDTPFEYGFRPFLTTKITPFAQRTDNYVMQNKYNIDDLNFVRNYEDMFLTFLEQGQFKAFNEQVDFSDSSAINFVGNFWQGNPDLYEKTSTRRNYFNSYERAARRILGGVSTNDINRNFDYIPSAMDFSQTTLRDPASYQIYNKILRFMAQYKQYLQPYSQESLHYVGVNITNVEVSDLETYFDLYQFNASNAIYYTNQELTSGAAKQNAITENRLNHKVFSVRVVVKSVVKEQVTVKLFIAPENDSLGVKIKMEDNWMNFVEIDKFSLKLTTGENVIERNSTDFVYFKEDSLSIGDIYKLLEEGKLPVDMLYNYNKLPNRLMLPRGTQSGFPLNIFVVIYKSQGVQNEPFFLDDKPLGYPLDRPVTENFLQPNMFIDTVVVRHRGNENPNSYQVVNQDSDSPTSGSILSKLIPNLGI